MSIQTDGLLASKMAWSGTTRGWCACLLDWEERLGKSVYKDAIEKDGLAYFLNTRLSPALYDKKNGLVKKGYFVVIPNTHPQEVQRTRPSEELLKRVSYKPIGGKRTKAPKKHQDRIANLNAKYGEELRQSYPHCACCGIHLPHIHYAQVDHRVSIAKEGKEIIEGNLCLMCMPCNLVKQDKTIETARMEIKRKGVKIDLGLSMNAERVHTSIDLKIPADYLK